KAESADRLEALDTRVHESEDHVADLGELQASLDGGLGELRSAIEALRHDTATLAQVQADLHERLDAAAASTPAAAGTKAARGRILGGRSADLAAVSAATDNLVREQLELQAKLGTLEDAVRRAVDAAAMAAAESSKLAPLRSHVRVLDDELSAQHEAIEALKLSVERAAKKRAAPKAPAPAARAPRATKR
ncbi:MAG TPA: hypothetical protein VHT97_09790, partial [Acidimicrobiales bacterium]|nr:hypothetical protein [Acidimicrobiales bacterium]